MSTSSIASAQDIQFDYMKLLVAQLQNQNPLDPVDNDQMAAQLTRFSQLWQLESMKTSFTEMLASAERTYAHSLVGKNVSYLIRNSLTGSVEKNTDVVNEVYNDVEGEPLFIVGRRTVGLADVINSLIGTEVSFLVKNEDGSVTQETDTIGGISTSNDGEIGLAVGRHTLGIEDVAASLVGKSVSYLIETETGAVEGRSSIIEKAYKKDGASLLTVGLPVVLDEIISVGY